MVLINNGYPQFKENKRRTTNILYLEYSINRFNNYMKTIRKRMQIYKQKKPCNAKELASEESSHANSQPLIMSNNDYFMVIRNCIYF